MKDFKAAEIRKKYEIEIREACNRRNAARKKIENDFKAEKQAIHKKYYG